LSKNLTEEEKQRFSSKAAEELNLVAWDPFNVNQDQSPSPRTS
jgi:hypothetical protein